jgi:HEAT repeat protein
MTTSVPRLFKAIAAVALFNGVLVLSVSDDLYAADKEKEAKKLAADLKSAKDTKTKINALTELGKLGQLMKSLVADAMPDIYKSLDDKDAGVRAAAAICLGMCDDDPEKAVPPLVKILKDDKSDEAKIGAAKGLGAMGPNAKAAVPALSEIRNKLKDDKKSALGKNAQNALKSIQARQK